MLMKYSSIFIDKNIEPMEIIELYHSVGWGKSNDYSESAISLVIINTTSIIYVRNEEGVLVGMVRILSDSVITTYIAEVLVRKEYQRTGIGRSMIEKAKAQFKNTSIYLDTLPGIEVFAEKCGFVKRDGMSVFSKHSA